MSNTDVIGNLRSVAATINAAADSLEAREPADAGNVVGDSGPELVVTHETGVVIPDASGIAEDAPVAAPESDPFADPTAATSAPSSEAPDAEPAVEGGPVADVPTSSDSAAVVDLTAETDASAEAAPSV